MIWETDREFGMTLDELTREVFTRIDLAIENDELPKGLLFHGTGEPIEGPLTTGAYDDVLWTSDSPVIAQSYIPNAGLSMYMHRPLDYKMKDRVWPQEHSGWYELAKQMSGLDCFDIEHRHGQVDSFRAPKDWPTYGDCWAFLTSQNGLGYEDQDTLEVSQRHEDGVYRSMPANYQLPGQLFVTLADRIEFRDLRVSDEPDLLVSEYHNTGLFKNAWEKGVEGIVINDHAQIKGWGNVGHTSFGISPKKAEETLWISIPAVHFSPPEWDDFRRVTPDVRAWHEQMSAELRVSVLK